MFFPIVWFSVLLIISKSFAREIRLGRTTYNEDDAEIQEVAEKAMEQVNEQTNYRNLYKLVKVISAQTQVVAGIKYYLTILAAPTTCRKGAVGMNPMKCTIDNSKSKKQFKIEVWSAPWQNTFKVTLI
ncbi:cystatin [Wuchereria bancrofti]|uniref:Cystatin n=1 Tax=Wuchereria bancrofti TaxID=6293 RepID=J9EKH2_WUCBA|nr:cystatin [Wuchereria bancrofti]